jgi:hypothetical protein
MDLSPNDLVGRWKVEFEDGKTGWLTLEPPDNTGWLPGRMFVAKAVVDYPPNQKRPGMDYKTTFLLWHRPPLTLERISDYAMNLTHSRAAERRCGSAHLLPKG